jgi:hypothetical protein
MLESRACGGKEILASSYKTSPGAEIRFTDNQQHALWVTNIKLSPSAIGIPIAPPARSTRKDNSDTSRALQCWTSERPSKMQYRSKVCWHGSTTPLACLMASQWAVRVSYPCIH